MRWYGVLLGVLCTGCATLSRDLGAELNEDTGRYERPTEETVYVVSAEDALMLTRRIFEEKRYSVFEKVDGDLELFTSAFEPGNNPVGTRTFERYYVKAERLASFAATSVISTLKSDDVSVAPTVARAGGSFAKNVR